MQTSTWDVANSGQVVVHFPLDEKLRFAGLYASLVNERETIAEERDAWQTIVAIAGVPFGVPGTTNMIRIATA